MDNVTFTKSEVLVQKPGTRFTVHYDKKDYLDEQKEKLKKRREAARNVRAIHMSSLVNFYRRYVSVAGSDEGEELRKHLAWACNHCGIYFHEVVTAYNKS
jgi:hypothetical protein